MAVSSISPMYVGQTLPNYTRTLTTNSGVVVNLTGAILSMKLVNQMTGQVIICSGTWVIDNASQGLAHYPWQVGDTAVAGVWDAYVVAAYSGSNEDFQPETIVIAPHP